jgi:hypothetical protein
VRGVCQFVIRPFDRVLGRPRMHRRAKFRATQGCERPHFTVSTAANGKTISGNHDGASAKPQHYRSGLEVTIGPIAKVVAALSSDPDRLVKFRAELDALIDKYSSRTLVHQSYLMTRAIKRA